MYKSFNKKQKIQVWVVLTIILVAFFSLLGYILLRNSHLEKKIEEIGIITDAFVIRYEEVDIGGYRSEPCIIHLGECSYQVNNETYRLGFYQESKNPPNVPLGKSFQIKYLPEEPWKWVWVDKKEVKKYFNW
ncbi:hypothetical protein LJB98_04500 [Bacteroidales bacterium OttesenSCG-928-M11]|nr:hypothetical protein [Bacteroidales bacterium OttesenSCG-928-M11]